MILDSCLKSIMCNLKTHIEYTFTKKKEGGNKLNLSFFLGKHPLSSEPLSIFHLGM